MKFQQHFAFKKVCCQYWIGEWITDHIEINFKPNRFLLVSTEMSHDHLEPVTISAWIKFLPWRKMISTLLKLNRWTSSMWLHLPKCQQCMSFGSWSPGIWATCLPLTGCGRGEPQHTVLHRDQIRRGTAGTGRSHTAWRRRWTEQQRRFSEAGTSCE